MLLTHIRGVEVDEGDERCYTTGGCDLFLGLLVRLRQLCKRCRGLLGDGHVARAERGHEGFDASCDRYRLLTLLIDSQAQRPQCVLSCRWRAVAQKLDGGFGSSRLCDDRVRIGVLLDHSPESFCSKLLRLLVFGGEQSNE